MRGGRRQESTGGRGGVSKGWVGAGHPGGTEGLEEGGTSRRIKTKGRASLVAQWLRVCLPMQETRVRALVWEDPTCRGATGPVSHNY